jgi:hypothetical protein
MQFIDPNITQKPPFKTIIRQRLRFQMDRLHPLKLNTTSPGVAIGYVSFAPV